MSSPESLVTISSPASPSTSSSPPALIPPPSPIADESPPYALTRASKKHRPPVSIFDLPCPPTAAPPTDTEGFFKHLESVERTVQEEDTSNIPKDLEAGPQILVESLNKKRVKSRVGAAVSETVPTGDTSPQPSTSSVSANPLPASSNNTNTAAQCLKRVRFSLESNQTILIESRKRQKKKHPEDKIESEAGSSSRPSRSWRSSQSSRRSRLSSPLLSPPSSGDAGADADTETEDVFGNSSRSLSRSRRRGRILTPSMLRDDYDTKQLRKWESNRRQNGLAASPTYVYPAHDNSNNEEVGPSPGSRANTLLSPTTSEDPDTVAAEAFLAPALGRHRLSHEDEIESEVNHRHQRRRLSEDRSCEGEVSQKSSSCDNNDDGTRGDNATSVDVLVHTIPEMRPASPEMSPEEDDALQVKEHLGHRGEPSIDGTGNEAALELLVNDLSGSPNRNSADKGNSSSVSNVMTATISKPKKGKEPIKSLASMIGSRRKYPVDRISSAVRHTQPTTRMPSLQRTVSVIALDDDEVDASPAGPSNQPTQPIEASNKTGSEPATSKPTTVAAALVIGDKPVAKPLSSLRVYTIPENMDTVVFNTMRERTVELGGVWCGPKIKVLRTDPRAKQEVPILDQENTTHIVTAFTSIDAVKRFLNVDHINPKIATVNREWLSDTIMYKRPMEPHAYTLVAKPNIAITHTSSPPELQDTPPSAQALSTDVDNGHQLAFKEIMQGIQEGSLDDGDVSDTNEHDAGEVYDGQGAEDEVVDLSRDEGEKTPRGLPVDEVERLRQEKRCFLCKDVGHWMKECPQRTHGSTNDEVLLQIIASGKSEGSNRRKILYQCQSPHVAGKKEEPRYNKAILEQLKILMDHYDKIKTKGSNEHFKVINYRKAITAIRALDYEITSEEMALKVPRVGKKIAQKIGECVALGRIKKLDHLDWDKDRSAVETLFRGVYGVGSEIAIEWYNKGYRTLDDLRKLPDLTKNQIAGLKYYEDLLVRIPRKEVEEIGKVVENVAKGLHPDITSLVTGSYRRGKLDCGDVDIVVARPNIDNGDELFVIMEHILSELVKSGFLVEHLSLPVWSDDMANKPKHFKYMGICKLPGDDAVHHHIDILVVPWVHHGAVLLYFTGNDICNRSMRLLASNRGMRLSDKGLFEGVIRGKSRKRVNEGRWVAGRTEREIFDYLKIQYLEPYEREC